MHVDRAQTYIDPAHTPSHVDRAQTYIDPAHTLEHVSQHTTSTHSKMWWCGRYVCTDGVDTGGMNAMCAQMRWCERYGYTDEAVWALDAPFVGHCRTEHLDTQQEILPPKTHK